jgi:hypothetical protein
MQPNPDVRRRARSIPSSGATDADDRRATNVPFRGVIVAQARMPSCKFTFPANGATIAADETFTLTLAIRNRTAARATSRTRTPS